MWHANSCPFLGTKKKVQLFCLLLCSIFTLHMPNCVILVWLSIVSLIFVFLVTTNCSFVSLGNNFFIYIIKLCSHHYLCQLYMAPLLRLCLMMFFRFAVFIEWLAFKLMELIFTSWMWSPCSWSATWLYVVDHTASCTPAHFSEVVHLVARHHLGGRLELKYLHFSTWAACGCIPFHLLFSCTYFIKNFHNTQTTYNCYLDSLGLNSFCPH